MGVSIEMLMKTDPPEEGQNWNCWLCDHVPPGNECKECPLMNGTYCEVFKEETKGKKLTDCKKKIKRVANDS